jgi:hypothetical protein
MWVQTDDTQFVKKISDTCFRVVDVIGFGTKNPKFFGEDFGVSDSIVELTDYSFIELEDILETYGYIDKAHFLVLYGDLANQVLAECVAETYPAPQCNPTFKTVDDALSYIQKTIMNGEVCI